MKTLVELIRVIALPDGVEKKKEKIYVNPVIDNPNRIRSPIVTPRAPE